MNIPNVAKGHLYPSTLRTRCPRFHRCTITNKCQSYDRTRLECQVCESRVRPPLMVKGVLAEGEFEPDLQDAMKVMRDAIRRPHAHPDQEAQKIDGYEISEKYDRVRKATEVLRMFQTAGMFSLRGQVEQAYLNPEARRMLGRLA